VAKSARTANGLTSRCSSRHVSVCRNSRCGMGIALIKRFKQFVEDAENGVPTITNIAVSNDGLRLQQIYEGKWISGRFDRNIRLDQATHLLGDGQPHAHVFGRKGDEIVAVNLDGTGSHGSKGRLHPDDAGVLRARGYEIPTDRIIEWPSLAEPVQVLLG
jgi:hypothetical protein